VISYNIYWLVVIVGFSVLGYKERKGHWPLQKPRPGVDEAESDTSSQKQDEEKKHAGVASSAVREVSE
jgi:high-affinity iron transporter